MSEEIKEIIYDIKDSLNETPKKMYKYNKITFNLNELSEILKYVEQLENIRKEAIKTIEEDILGKKIENVNWNYDECYYSDMPVERVKHLLNILNKGSESNV